MTDSDGKVFPMRSHSLVISAFFTLFMLIAALWLAPAQAEPSVAFTASDAYDAPTCGPLLLPEEC